MFGIKNKYYCLVASLKEYALDFSSKGAELPNEIRDEISSELSSADRESLELLYMFYDIENIISTIKGGTSLFSPLGNLKKEEIVQEIEHCRVSANDDEPYQSKLPGEIGIKLDNFFKDEKGDIEQLHSELLNIYYSLASQSNSKFLRLWSCSDRTIRNIIAVSYAKAQGIDPISFVIGDSEIEQTLVSSMADDFGMAADFEWFEELMSTLQIEDFIEREKKLDTLKWNIADSLCEQEFFSIDYLLGYMVHLNILARWSFMDKESGDKRFREIVSSFTENLNLE